MVDIDIRNKCYVIHDMLLDQQITKAFDMFYDGKNENTIYPSVLMDVNRTDLYVGVSAEWREDGKLEWTYDIADPKNKQYDRLKEIVLDELDRCDKQIFIDRVDPDIVYLNTVYAYEDINGDMRQVDTTDVYYTGKELEHCGGPLLRLQADGSAVLENAAFENNFQEAFKDFKTYFEECGRQLDAFCMVCRDFVELCREKEFEEIER